MFGGEPMFDDQVAAVAYLFPNATIRSCTYGSIDAGVVAVSAGSPDPAEQIVLSAAAIVEILVDEDEGPVPAEQPNIPGTLVVVVTRQDSKDAMEIMVNTDEPPPAASGNAIIEMLNEQRPTLKKHIEMGLVAPAKVCFKSICDMKANPRSGKLPEIIDLRLSTVADAVQ
ncbi:AMP-dependent synthetase ligase [Fusarium agapanthi]|uniref:AMP-dependent synthetase ligase n=1 Tax=Fusarium agapanthi TaxID=1803897 RepID=A0A9P5EF22_9HYPO|nr:AMP-dependent synthetase ligase [Fusarium agapanthi]